MQMQDVGSQGSDEDRRAFEQGYQDYEGLLMEQEYRLEDLLSDKGDAYGEGFKTAAQEREDEFPIWAVIANAVGSVAAKLNQPQYADTRDQICAVLLAMDDLQHRIEPPDDLLDIDPDLIEADYASPTTQWTARRDFSRGFDDASCEMDKETPASDAYERGYAKYLSEQPQNVAA